MQQDKESQLTKGFQSRHRKFWLRLWVLLGTVLAVFFIAAFFVPVLDVHKRQFANESVTVSRLRRLDALQRDYAASHPWKGFACQLDQLKASIPTNHSYNRDEFLVTGEQNGYRFAFSGCQADRNGMVREYQITAVPLRPGESGFRAFCIDQTGVIRYGSDGSGQNCLSMGSPLH